MCVLLINTPTGDGSVVPGSQQRKVWFNLKFLIQEYIYGSKQQQEYIIHSCC
jgi:hypothetical protein